MNTHSPTPWPVFRVGRPNVQLRRGVLASSVAQFFSHHEDVGYDSHRKNGGQMFSAGDYALALSIEPGRAVHSGLWFVPIELDLASVLLCPCRRLRSIHAACRRQCAQAVVSVQSTRARNTQSTQERELLPSHC